MKTPKEYSENLKKCIVTEEMLRDCLYSVNKRAKNCRDMERSYRKKRYDKYNNSDKYRENKEMYYSQKEILLSILDPVCIHKEHCGYQKRRIYDYEKDYRKYWNEFVHKNSYYDGELYRKVHFGDINLMECPVYHYYIFYELAGRSFHTPIEECDIKNYLSLEVISIDQIITFGNDISDLISTQFVKKVIALIKNTPEQIKIIA